MFSIRRSSQTLCFRFEGARKLSASSAMPARDTRAPRNRRSAGSRTRAERLQYSPLSLCRGRTESLVYGQKSPPTVDARKREAPRWLVPEEQMSAHGEHLFGMWVRRLGSRRRIDAFSSALLDPAHVPTSRARRLTTRGEGQVRADRGTGRWAEEKEAAAQASMAGRGWREARTGLRRREGNKQARCTNRALKSKIGLA